MFGELSYAIGGLFGMATYPMYPVFEETYNRDGTADYTNVAGLPVFMFYGEYDPIFPAQAGMDEISTVFTNLGIAAQNKYEVDMTGLGHVVDCRMFEVMMAFVNDGSITSVDDYTACAEEEEEYEASSDLTQTVSMTVLLAAMGGAAFVFWPLVLANAVWLGPSALVVLLATYNLTGSDEKAWDEWEDSDKDEYEDDYDWSDYDK